jgi:hypothetical protein
MPNIVVDKEDMLNVIAYILSFKGVMQTIGPAEEAGYRARSSSHSSPAMRIS